MKKLLTIFVLLLLPFVASAKIDPCLGIESNEYFVDGRGFVATLGQPFESPSLNNSYGVGPIVWTSSNPEVATVDANGIITLVGVGQTQIVASFAGNEEYEPGKAEYSLVVEGTDSDTDPEANPDPNPNTDNNPDPDTNESSTTYMKWSEEGTVAIEHNNQSGNVIIDKTTEIDGKIYKVTAIGAYAFYNNQGITSVTIPEGLTYIGTNAFFGCSNLHEITIGKDVKTIGPEAFSYIGTAASARTRSEENSLIVNCYANNVPMATSCLSYDGTLLLKDAFDGTDIAHATLRVPEYLFEEYKETSPWSRFGTIESIPGTEAVSKTIHLEYAGMLPQYISEEEKYTISELTLSGKVNGTDLRLIREMAGSDVKRQPTNRKLMRLDMTEAFIYDGGEPYLEPSGTDMMGNTFTIPYESKTNVLGENMFAGCEKLNEIKLPRAIIAIEDYAFSGASNLKSLVIPKYVQKIGVRVLGGCNKLKSLDVDPENEYFNSPSGSNGVIKQFDKTLVLGCCYTQIPENSATTLGSDVFAGLGFYTHDYLGGHIYCDILPIKIPEGVKTIKRSAFEYSNFKNLELSEGLETIENSAFRNIIIGIQRITIPSTVKNIGDSVFIWSNLKVIVSKIKDPSQVKYGTFLFDKTERYPVLYVPKGSLAAYESSPYWGYRHFEKIVEGEPEDENSETSISAIVCPQANKDVYYNLQGQRVKTPTKGLYIKNGRKVLIK